MNKNATAKILITISIIAASLSIFIVIAQITPAKNVSNVLSFIGPGKTKILIVPGHEPNDGGAEYNKIKEET
jgi:hypothetical protein